MSAHTSGPWNDGIYHAVTNGGRTYAHVVKPGALVPVACVPLGVEGCSREEGEANARLIAAAPEMYDALHAMLVAFLVDDDDRSDGAQLIAVKEAMDSIAKAEDRT